MDAELSQNGIDHAASEMRMVFEDGTEAVNLLEPLDMTIRSHLITLALAYLVQFEPDDPVAPSENWLRSLRRTPVNVGYNEFVGKSVRVTIKHDLDGNWWAWVGNNDERLAAFVMVNTRREVRALLSGLQLI